MFDAKFYQTVLPQSVRQSCDAQPEHVPAVELHLQDGTTLDLCHIEALGESWLAVAYFRNPTEGNEVDLALVQYPLVQWITVSMHPPHVRHIGFDIDRSIAASIVTPAAGAAIPSTASSTGETQIPDAHTTP